VFLALLAGILTFVEYNAPYPSVVAFRDAPPVKQIRFLGLFSMIFMLTVLCKHSQEPTRLTMMADALARALGDALMACICPCAWPSVRCLPRRASP